MDHRRFVFVNLCSGPEEIAEQTAAGTARQKMIAVLTGHDDLDFDAALMNRANQLMADAAIRQKVWRRNVYAFLSRGEQGLKEYASARGHARRERAVNDKGRCFASRIVARREKFDVRKNLAGGFKPVLDKSR